MSKPSAVESQPAEQSGAAKIMNAANLIRKDKTKAQAGEVIRELQQYLTIRTLQGKQYGELQELPDDLREEVGSSNLMDEIVDRIGAMDPETWDALEETYGSADGGDAKFSVAELQALVAELKTDRSQAQNFAKTPDLSNFFPSELNARELEKQIPMKTMLEGLQNTPAASQMLTLLDKRQVNIGTILKEGLGVVKKEVIDDLRKQLVPLYKRYVDDNK